MYVDVSADSVRIYEFFNPLDFTDYPSLGAGFTYSKRYEPGEYVLVNIVRIGRQLFPLGYLRAEPFQSLLLEVERNVVTALDFMGDENYSDFINDLVSGDTVLHSSYVMVTDKGSTVLWFRRFPRTFVSYISPRVFASFLRSGYLDYYYFTVNRANSIMDYIREDGGYGCFPFGDVYRICFDTYRVYPDGEVGRR